MQNFRTNIKNIKIQLLEFQASTIRSLIEEKIVAKIHLRMATALFSQKIIDNTYLENVQFIGTKKVRFFIVSELFSEQGFDVALAREKGTKDHNTRKIGEDGKPVTQHFFDEGVEKFSKGHDVKGIPALEIVKNTVQEFAPQVQEEYSLRLREFLDKSVGGES